MTWKTQLPSHFQGTFDRKTLRGSFFPPEVDQAEERKRGGETEERALGDKVPK